MTDCPQTTKVLVQPCAPLATEHHHHHDDHHHNNDHMDLAGMIHDTNGHVLNSVHTASRHSGNEHSQLQHSISQVGGDLHNALNTHSRATGLEHSNLQHRISDAEGKVSSLVCESGKDNMQLVHSSTNSIVGHVVGASNTVRDTLERKTDKLSESVERLGLANLSAIKEVKCDLGLAMERGHGELRSVIADTKSTVLLTSKESLLELCKAKNDLERQAADNRASIEYKALENREALARQLAECCCEIKEQQLRQHCEIKEKVDARATQTELLIREIDAQRIRDALTQANSENTFLRLQATLGGGTGV